MNKSFIKFLTDFGPLVIFFYYYYDSNKDLKIAIPPFIIATIIALGVMWFLEKQIPRSVERRGLRDPPARGNSCRTRGNSCRGEGRARATSYYW